MTVQKLVWRLETALFIVATYPLAHIPFGLSLRVSKFLGMLMFACLRKRRKIAVENVAESLPYLRSHPEWQEGEVTPDEIVRRMFDNLGRSLIENLRLYYGRGRDILSDVEFRGLEHYEEAKRRGKGVAFITGHCGNWELVALSCGVLYGSVAVVARKQDNPILNALVEKMRLQYGNSVIYKQGALRQIFSLVRKNATIGILIDQGVKPDEGVLIDFLGRPAWTTKMPSLIARKSGVALLPSFAHREGERHVVTFYPAVELSAKEEADGVLEDMKHLSTYVEDYIVRHPAEWYWVHRRWKRVPATPSA